MTALVWDGQCRVASEKQGYPGYPPPNIGHGAHAEYGRGRGLVKLWHPLNFHRTRTGQIQGLQGAVDSVQGRILQGQVKADISAVYLISKWDIRIFSLIYLRYFDIIDKCKIYMGDLFLKRDEQGINNIVIG